MSSTASHRRWRIAGALLAISLVAACSNAHSTTHVAAAPVPSDPAADIRAENAKPGAAHWRLTKPARAGELEGFADHVSVLPGQTFGLYVSTTAAHFTVHAFRAGWYGGDRAREVWTSAS